MSSLCRVANLCSVGSHIGERVVEQLNASRAIEERVEVLKSMDERMSKVLRVFEDGMKACVALKYGVANVAQTNCEDEKVSRSDTTMKRKPTSGLNGHEAN